MQQAKLGGGFIRSLNNIVRQKKRIHTELELHDGRMAKINWRRVVVSGIVTGFVWGLLYALIHPVVEAHDTSGKPVLPLTPFHGADVVIRAIVMVNPIVLGIFTMWLYAAIYPRYGPGLRTAVIAGFAVWFLSSWVHVSWAAFTQVPLGTLVGPLGTTLPVALAAAIAGARLYKE